MRKFAFALVAMATALAICPVAMADTITVSGLIVQNGTVQPDLGHVYGIGDTGVFANELPTPVLLSSSATAGVSDTYTLLSTGPIGDSFTISSTRDQNGNTVSPYWITFSVTSSWGPSGQNNLASGAATIDDGGQIIQATWGASTANQGDAVSFTFDTATTPEPSSLLLLGTGLLGLAFFLLRKNKPSSLVLHS